MIRHAAVLSSETVNAPQVVSDEIMSYYYDDDLPAEETEACDLACNMLLVPDTITDIQELPGPFQERARAIVDQLEIHDKISAAAGRQCLEMLGIAPEAA